MDIRFSSSPLANSVNTYEFLDSVLRDEAVDEVDFVVAWAKRSGLSRLKGQIENFRGRGGVLRCIVGVSQGGATVEGLEDVISLADSAWVFHDPSRTFHPKLYFARGEGTSQVLLGSSNLTAGGLGDNFEAGFTLTLNHGERDELALADEVATYISTLLSDQGSCRALTEELIQELLSDSSIDLGTERMWRQSGNSGVTTASAPPLFTRTTLPTKPLPRPQPALGTASEPSRMEGNQRTGAPRRPAGTASRVTRRWFKKLKHSDAQQTKHESSKRTGNLRLSAEHFAIDKSHYFAQELFGGLAWETAPGGKAVTTVTFDVEVGADHLGLVDLEVSHAVWRAADQGNVTTVLHWGRLSQPLQAVSYVGQFVTIERTNTDEFRLTISPEPTGEFLR